MSLMRAVIAGCVIVMMSNPISSMHVLCRIFSNIVLFLFFLIEKVWFLFCGFGE